MHTSASGQIILIKNYKNKVVSCIQDLSLKAKTLLRVIAIGLILCCLPLWCHGTDLSLFANDVSCVMLNIKLSLKRGITDGLFVRSSQESRRFTYVNTILSCFVLNQFCLVRKLKNSWDVQFFCYCSPFMTGEL